MFKNPAKTPKTLPRVGEVTSGILPTGGLNARDAYTDMPLNDAVALRNLISGAFGLVTRSGYQEWATGLPNNLPVGTLMSYYSADAGFSGAQVLKYPTSIDKILNKIPYRAAVDDVELSGQLFACTNFEIFDVSLGGSGPWVPETGVGTVTSDFWAWRNFQNAAGNFLLATNHEGGYVAYGGAGFDSGFDSGFAILGSGFTRITQGEANDQIQGVDPNLFANIVVWKGRVWFVEHKSSRAWYLPPAQITGEAHQFDFGPQFRHGGHLVSLTNWTIDGGEGIDDYLVAVGSEGDVVIYKGYDPDSAGENPAAFQLHGIWYVGPLPAGRRQVDPYGGDVYIFSSMGVKQVSKLVQTQNTEDQNIYNISSKIDPVLTAVVGGAPNSTDFYIKIISNEDAIILGIPEVVSGEGPIQFYYSITKRAWTPLYSLPVLCWATHDHLTFSGTNRAGVGLGGAVYLTFSNALDDVKLEPINPDANGTFIECRMIPAYHDQGYPGLWKTYEMVRPALIVDQPPSIAVNVLTDFKFPIAAPVFDTNQLPQSLWDVDLWNQAIWGASSITVKNWVGVIGGGYMATIQLDFYAAGGSRIPGYDWWFKHGGPL